MTLLIPFGFAQASVALKLATLSRPAYITFGVQTLLEDNPTDSANAIQGLTVTHLAPRLDSGVSIGPTTVRLAVSDGEPLTGVSTTALGTGAVAGSSTPPQVALLVTKFTSRGGRRGKGRMFIPWAVVATSMQEDGIIPSGSLTPWQTALNNWLAALSSASVAMALLHSEGESSPGSPNLVTSLVANALSATQRRRLGR